MLPNLSTLAVSPGNVIVRCSACASLFRKASPTGCKTCGKRKLETSEGPVRDRERAYEQEPNKDESNPPFRPMVVTEGEPDVPFGPSVVTEDEPEMFNSLRSTDDAKKARVDTETEADLEGVEAQKGDLYANVQLQYSIEKHQKEEDNMKELAGIFKTERHEKSAKHRLANTESHMKGIAYWMKQDYSMTSVKTADELFHANYGKLDNRVSADLEIKPEPYPIFAPAWHVWYKDHEDPNYRVNIETQTALLDHTYEEYVRENTQSKAVQKWTKEEDETAEAAPHQIMEDWLLKAARLYDPQKDRLVFSNEGVTMSLMKNLYNLVTQAPRCPVMMSFVRTVIFETRLPNEWFKRKHRRKMEAGDSVVLPVFMSTSNMEISQSWYAHGPDSLGVHPFRQPTENCCVMQVIVSKGTPMLPLGDFKSNTDHAHENEILLPPGIELVYLGDDVFDFNPVDYFVGIHTFITRV